MIFLITGDQGFIGSNLKKLLQKKKIKFITAKRTKLATGQITQNIHTLISS